MDDGPDFTWYTPMVSDVLRTGDTGYAEGVEALEIEQWLDSGAPPVEEWEAAKRGEQVREAVATFPASAALPELPPVALAVSRKQAAALLGISLDTFRDQVLPQLPVVQLGRRQLIPLDELQRWMNEHKAYALKAQR